MKKLKAATAMKITVRIEKDKHHFIKKCFGSIDEAKAYLDMAGICETKQLLKAWMREVRNG